MLSCHCNEWGHQASGPSCVPEWKVMEAAPWITSQGLDRHRSPWFIHSRRGQPWEEVRCIQYAASTHSAYSPVPACAVSTHKQEAMGRLDTHTDMQIHTTIVRTPKVISGTAAFICSQPRQSANKRQISTAIHLQMCLPVPVYLNMCLAVVKDKKAVRWL